MVQLVLPGHDRGPLSGRAGVGEDGRHPHEPARRLVVAPGQPMRRRRVPRHHRRVRRQRDRREDRLGLPAGGAAAGHVEDVRGALHAERVRAQAVDRDDDDPRLGRG